MQSFREKYAYKASLLIAVFSVPLSFVIGSILHSFILNYVAFAVTLSICLFVLLLLSAGLRIYSTEKDKSWKDVGVLFFATLLTIFYILITNVYGVSDVPSQLTYQKAYYISEDEPWTFLSMFNAYSPHYIEPYFNLLMVLFPFVALFFSIRYVHDLRNRENLSSKPDIFYKISLILTLISTAISLLGFTIFLSQSERDIFYDPVHLILGIFAIIILVFALLFRIIALKINRRWVDLIFYSIAYFINVLLLYCATFVDQKRVKIVHHLDGSVTQTPRLFDGNFQTQHCFYYLQDGIFLFVVIIILITSAAFTVKYLVEFYKQNKINKELS